MDENMKNTKVVKLKEIIVDDEFSKMVTLPSEEDISALRDSIKQEGFQSYLIVMPRNDKYVVIDGHTRLKILRELGYEEVPVLIVHPKDRIDAMALVIRYNLARRQLTPSQRSILVASLENLYNKVKEKAKENQQIGGKTKEKIENKTHTAETLAKVAGVSEKLVRNARKIVKEAPHLAKKVQQGEISISKAVNMIDKEKSKEEAPLVQEKYVPKEHISGSFTYKNTKIVHPFKDVPPFRVGIFFSPDFPIPDSVVQSNAVIYFVSDQKNLMNTLIQVDALNGFNLKDVVVFSPSKLTNIFIVKAVKGFVAEKYPKVRNMRGNLYDAVYFMVENAVPKDDLVFMFNAPDAKVLRIPYYMSRKVYAVETDVKKFDKNKLLLDDPMLIVDVGKILDAHTEKVSDPNVKVLVEWLWLKLKKTPQEEFDKFTKPFFVKEGTAAKELLKLHSLEEIKEVAKKVSHDKFWGPKLTVKLLYDHWAELKTLTGSSTSFIGEDNSIEELYKRGEDEEE